MRKPYRLAALGLVLTISSNLAAKQQEMLLFDRAEEIDTIVGSRHSVLLATDLTSVVHAESTTGRVSPSDHTGTAPDAVENEAAGMISEWMDQGQELLQDRAVMLIAACSFLLVVALLITFLVAIRRRKRATPRPLSVDSQVVRGRYSPPFCLLRDLSQATGREAHDITGRLTRISRAPAQDTPQVRTIVIKDNHISREHALIEYKNYGYWISDRGSVNGTFVNSQRLTGERLLKHGDGIRFHKYDFEIDLPEVADESKTILDETPTTGEHTSRLSGEHSMHGSNKSQPF